MGNNLITEEQLELIRQFNKSCIWSKDPANSKIQNRRIRKVTMIEGWVKIAAMNDMAAIIVFTQ